MKIGVIGLGAMGSRIARNYVDAGYEVFVCNRTKTKSIELVERGARWCDSPKAIAESADTIFTILTNDEASKSVWLDPEIGIIRGLGRNKIGIESSTISHKWAIELATELRSFNYLEAPLVGSRPQADARQLTILVGGDQDNYEKVKNLLAVTSAKVPYVGEHGKAIALKLATNSLFGIQTVAFAELYSTLLLSGFDREQIMKILPNLPITSPIMQMMLSLFAEEKFAPLFPIDLVEKDFAYAKELVEAKGLNAYLVSATQNVYRYATEAGFGDQNISGIINIYNGRRRK